MIKLIQDAKHPVLGNVDRNRSAFLKKFEYKKLSDKWATRFVAHFSN